MRSATCCSRSSTSPAISRPIPRRRFGMRTPSSNAASDKSRPNWPGPAATPPTLRSTSWRPSGSAPKPPKTAANSSEGPSSVVRQEVYQTRGIPAVAATRLHLGIELVDECCHRQPRFVALGLGQADAQVLAHPVDGEAEVELALDHGVGAVVHLPGLRGALRDDLDQLRAIEPGLLREVHALREALQQPGDADLVNHLGQLTRADRAHQHAGASI